MLDVNGCAIASTIEMTYVLTHASRVGEELAN
jgi:hypothetical protein